MPDAQDLFHANMRDADTHTAIYNFLSGSVGGPVKYDDLLRSKVVYAVSAFDKLMHDLIRTGMVATFLGQRVATPKYLTEAISLSVVQQLSAANAVPPEIIFDNVMRKKLKILSFQEPVKVADGLSYIWNENQKWYQIATVLGKDESSTRTTLKLIADRRNSIVHEADLDPVTETKIAITPTEAADVFSFLHDVGDAICSLVK